MTTNMGKIDRIIRVIIAVVCIVLYFTQIVTGGIGIVLILVSVIMAGTSFISFCPLYLPFKISTKSKNEN